MNRSQGKQVVAESIRGDLQLVRFGPRKKTYVLVNAFHHLWDDEKLECLALTYASHSKCTLCIVPESHVFA